MGVAVPIALSALILGAGGNVTSEVALATLVLAGFASARQVLMPLINRARDAEMRGKFGADRRFRRLHLVSLIINGFQWLAVPVVLIQFLV